MTKYITDQPWEILIKHIIQHYFGGQIHELCMWGGGGGGGMGVVGGGGYVSGNGGAKVAVVFTEFYSSARASGSVPCPVHAFVGVWYMPSLVSGTSIRPDVTSD